jgi:hypothetical protein
MCTGAEIAIIGASVLGGAASYKQRQDSLDAMKDAKRERLEAVAEADRKANTAMAFQKKALEKNSLFTGGGTTGAPQSTLGVG